MGTSDFTRVFYATEDTYVIEHQPDLINGTSNTLKVGMSYPGGAHPSIDQGADWQTLVKFDLSSLPVNATITQAVLKLSFNTARNSNDYKVAYAHRATGRDWREDFVNWYSRPQLSTERIINQTSSNSLDNLIYSEWDVTTLVRQWVSATSANYGFVIVGGPGQYINSSSSDTRWGYANYQMSYFSSESRSITPMLTIRYTNPRASPSPSPRSFTPITGNYNFISLVPLPTNFWASPTPASGDQNAPLISNLSTTAEGNQVIITWNTNELASTEVKFGVNNNYNNSSGFNATLSLFHRVSMLNIFPGNYNFKAISKDTAGNEAFQVGFFQITTQQATTGNEPPESEQMADDLTQVVPESEQMADNPNQNQPQPGDQDGDGVADVNDWDCNGDGVPNGEIDGDFNCDGVPDISEDLNGDGIPENEVDVDQDGIPNVQDPDDDNDGVLDEQDADQNGDGVPDAQEDLDLDGVPNAQDPDDDGDAIADGLDLDRDGDGVRNADQDPDGDGIPNEQDLDDDEDSLPDTQDPDDDGDMIPDNEDSDPGGIGQGLPLANEASASGLFAGINQFKNKFGATRFYGIVLILVSMLILLLIFLLPLIKRKLQQPKQKSHNPKIDNEINK